MIREYIDVYVSIYMSLHLTNPYILASSVSCMETNLYILECIHDTYDTRIHRYMYLHIYVSIYLIYVFSYRVYMSPYI